MYINTWVQTDTGHHILQSKAAHQFEYIFRVSEVIDVSSKNKSLAIIVMKKLYYLINSDI